MNPLHPEENSSALYLKDNCIFLARDGTMSAYTKAAAMMMNASNDRTLMNGRMLALYHVRDSDDVHYPVWEMHPEGDELLVVADGAISVEVRNGGRCCTTRLSPHGAFVVPATMWHRLIVHEPSVLIVITPRHNTVHEI